MTDEEVFQKFIYTIDGKYLQGKYIINLSVVANRLKTVKLNLLSGYRYDLYDKESYNEKDCASILIKSFAWDEEPFEAYRWEVIRTYLKTYKFKPLSERFLV